MKEWQYAFIGDALPNDWSGPMQARFKMVDTNVFNAQGQPTGSAQQAWQGSIHRTIIAHLEELAVRLAVQPQSRSNVP